jgi:hypothetical protein
MSIQILTGFIMATKFVITEKKRNATPTGHYVMEREFKKEARKVAELEKDLKDHEKTDMAHAHPMHRSHEAQGGSQKEAGIPSMRKY